MSDVTIQTANVSTIYISGGADQKRKAKYHDAKKLARINRGHILREEEFEDGFFLEVHFADESMKRIWEDTIGVKRKEGER